MAVEYTDFTGEISSMIKESIKVKENILSSVLIEKIAVVSGRIADSLKAGGKLIIFGNGGSAADAQHIAAEFIGRFKMERNSYSAIALTTDSSILTCIGNDYGFNEIFSRQVEGLARKGDVALGISTSGNSLNVVKALEAASKIDAYTVGLTGINGNKIGKAADICLEIPSDCTPHIQESHIMIGHIICDLVERVIG